MSESHMHTTAGLTDEYYLGKKLARLIRERLDHSVIVEQRRAQTWAIMVLDVKREKEELQAVAKAVKAAKEELNKPLRR